MRGLLLGALLGVLVGCAAVEPTADPDPGARPAKVARNRNVVRAFRAINPCPATGRTRGACPGWVVDHLMPLCAGGADSVGNMQWQALDAARLKDRDERRACAARW